MTSPLQSIVIADDDSVVLRLLARAVAELGYTLAGQAADGYQAVELVKIHRPDVLLADIHMPNVDGLQAMTMIVPLGSTAIVLLTGDTNPELARRALDAGASGYLHKPFEILQLGATLENAWHRFKTIQGLNEQTRLLEETLELRKLAEKAKGILMEEQGIPEAEAHRLLQKMSQDQSLPLKEVCRSVIQVRMVLGNKTRPSPRKP